MDETYSLERTLMCRISSMLTATYFMSYTHVIPVGDMRELRRIRSEAREFV